MTFLASGRNRQRIDGFTLVEAAMASAVMAMFVIGCFSAITFDQVAIRKAKEEAIVMDFLTHYVENIKALPFTAVAPGLPINSLYNGANGSPSILIPANNSWVPLDTTDFQTFDPDLLWIRSRNPKMQVTLLNNLVSGVMHDVDVNVKIDWDAPLGKGGRLEVQFDLLRTKDM